MKLIIDIDEDDYTMCQILAKEMCDTRMKLTDNLKYAISNGTPLPKGHGRLKDVDALLEKQYRIDDSATLSARDVVNAEDVDDALTIIEADKAESEEVWTKKNGYRNTKANG